MIFGGRYNTIIFTACDCYSHTLCECVYFVFVFVALCPCPCRIHQIIVREMKIEMRKKRRKKMLDTVLAALVFHSFVHLFERRWHRNNEKLNVNRGRYAVITPHSPNLINQCNWNGVVIQWRQGQKNGYSFFTNFQRPTHNVKSSELCVPEHRFS